MDSKTVEKPDYRVPSMEEITKLPKNGYKVVSTFSGCGGSCLGFEMAGFEVIWASEFIPAAQETYRLNHPDTILDTRDIRNVNAESILAATGLKRGEMDVLEGSPPCASFSTAGKREAFWGKVKKYSDTTQRTDDLFFEYARIVEGLQPKVFIAENVSGLVKGSSKGYFKEIMRKLKACGYKVKAQLLDAQWLGVPQARQRIIFMGVREDLGLEPVFPTPLPYRYSVRDALPNIVRQGDNGGFGKGAMRDVREAPIVPLGASPQTGNGSYSPAVVEVEAPVRVVTTNPTSAFRKDKKTHEICPSIMAGGIGGFNTSQYYVEVEEVGSTERRKFYISELKRICAFPDDFKLSGTYAQQWERLGRSVPPVMVRAIAEVVRDEILEA